METDAISEADDAAAVKARRDDLRAYATRIAEAIDAMPMPDSFIEADRAARFVTVADRMIVRLPEETAEDTKPARKRLRLYADRLLDSVKRLPMPETFIEGIRASRCVLAHDRMLTQLYEAPKFPASKFPASKFDDDLHDDPYEGDPKAAFTQWMAITDRMTTNFAAQCGYWPDGSAFVPGPQTDSHNPFDATDQITMAQDVEENGYSRAAALIIGRANAVAHAMALKTGRWPGGSRYTDGDDPQYFHISDRFDAEVRDIPRDPDTEPPDYIEEGWSGCGFPWWLVRRVKKDTG